MSTTQPTISQDAKDLIERMHLAIGIPYYDPTIFHEDAELHEPSELPYGGIHRGAEMFSVFEKVNAAVNRPTITLEDFLYNNGRAIGVMSAQTKSGEAFQALEEFLIRDNRIARIRIFFFDVGPMKRALAAAGITS
jgi:hypothetical protein